MNADEMDLAVALVSGAAVQLLDACRLLEPNVDDASRLAVRAISVARHEAMR